MRYMSILSKISLILLLTIPCAAQVTAYGANSTLLFSYTGAANGATVGAQAALPSPLVTSQSGMSAGASALHTCGIKVAADTTDNGSAMQVHNSEAASIVCSFQCSGCPGACACSTSSPVNSFKLFFGPSSCIGGAGTAGAGVYCNPAVQSAPLLLVFWKYVDSASWNATVTLAGSQTKDMLVRCMNSAGSQCQTRTGKGVAANFNGQYTMLARKNGAVNDLGYEDSSEDTCSGGCNWTTVTQANAQGKWVGYAYYMYRDLSTNCGVSNEWINYNGTWTQNTLNPPTAPRANCWLGFGFEDGFNQQYWFSIMNVNQNPNTFVDEFITDIGVAIGPPAGLIAGAGISAPAGW